MESLGMIALIAFGAPIAIGYIWLLYKALQVSPTWGFVVAVIPFAQVAFLFAHWKRAWKPFALFCTPFVIAALAMLGQVLPLIASVSLAPEEDPAFQWAAARPGATDASDGQSAMHSPPEPKIHPDAGPELVDRIERFVALHQSLMADGRFAETADLYADIQFERMPRAEWERRLAAIYDALGPVEDQALARVGSPEHIDGATYISIEIATRYANWPSLDKFSIVIPDGDEPRVTSWLIGSEGLWDVKY